MTGTILQANKGLDEAITAKGSSFFSPPMMQKDTSFVDITALKL